MNTTAHWYSRISIACLIVAAIGLVATCENNSIPQRVATADEQHNLHRDSEWHPSNCILAQFRQRAYDSLAPAAWIPRTDQPHQHFDATSVAYAQHNSADGASVTVRPSMSWATFQLPKPHNAHAVLATVSRGARWQTMSTSTINDVLLTAYAVSPHSTGKKPSDPGFGITYSGRKARVDWTVAVDPRVIPIGTLLYIEGVGLRMAEDTGGAVKGKHVDVLLKSDADAMQFGVRRHVKVYVLSPEVSAMKTTSKRVPEYSFTAYDYAIHPEGYVAYSPDFIILRAESVTRTPSQLTSNEKR